MTLGEGRNGLTLDRNASLRVLLIEDSEADGELVLAMLEDQFPNAQVHLEQTLAGGLARLAGQWFDLVLSDLTLPDAEGSAVVRAVRTTHPGTALMVLTGRADGELALWSLAEGAQDYLVKGQHDGPRLATMMLHALQRKRAEEEANRYLQLARGLLDALEAPTCAVDATSAIVAVNQAWRDFTTRNGGQDDECGVGVSYLDVCDGRAPRDGEIGAAEAATVAQGIRDVLSGALERFRFDYPCHSPTEERWFSVRVTPAVIKDGRGAVITHLDITDLQQMQRSMAHQSLHDPLTDLPNRVLALDRVQQAISDADRRGLAVAVTHLDLHDYQRVNDDLGYAGGDTVLVQVAQRLLAHLRPGDTLARLSGDEFLVLWRDLDPARTDEAVGLSQSLLRALVPPFHVGSRPLTVTANAGISVHVPGQGIEELMKATDSALHEAKGRGPGHVVLHTEELRRTTQLSRQMEHDLREALEGPQTQLVLHYQPIIDLGSGAVVGVESLVRWQHPELGLLGPHLFIPLAEETGLIHQLGDWVLDRAVRDAGALTHDGRELDVAVNFSVRQLGAGAAATVQQALADSGLRPARLVLEITESAFVEDEETTAATLDAMSRLGVGIAIDDFGTGYSSLLYLRRYPIDTLKIDREFVSGIGERPEDEAICASITSLAKAVGASTVGEGVETAEQYAVLRSMGCRLGQGWLWSPAVALDDLPAALDRCDAVDVVAPSSRMSRSTASVPPEVTAVIVSMHAEGASLHTIAAALNRTVGQHPRGVRWTARTVAQGLPVAAGQ